MGSSVWIWLVGVWAAVVADDLLTKIKTLEDPDQLWQLLTRAADRPPAPPESYDDVTDDFDDMFKSGETEEIIPIQNGAGIIPIQQPQKILQINPHEFQVNHGNGVLVFKENLPTYPHHYVRSNAHSNTNHGNIRFTIRRNKRMQMDDEYQSDWSDVSGDHGTSLAFVFDTTGSMSSELEQVRRQATALAEAMIRHPDKPIYDYIFVPFNDPDVGVVTQTTDHRYFRNMLDQVSVNGGGDCPEMSLTGLVKALEASKPRSFIYVFTDAGSKDRHLLDRVLTLIQRKQSLVVFLLTGLCYDEDRSFYEVISSTSGGQVFDLFKTDINKVLNFMKEYIHSNRVNLFSINSVVASKIPKPFDVPVDMDINEFTVSVVGKNPFLKVIDPMGKTAEPPQLKEMLNLTNIKVVNVKEPDPGLWTVKVGSDSSHTVRSSAISTSNINFNYGFSVIPTTSIDETAHRPLKGAANSLLITSSVPSSKCNLTGIRFLDFNGNVMARIYLTEVPGHSGVYVGGPVTPPSELFNIEVEGYDERGNKMVRIFPSAVAPQTPDLPEVTLKKELQVKSGIKLLIECFVESLVPVTVKWYKDGKAIANDFYNQSSKSVFTLGQTNRLSRGNYTCSASNIAGTAIRHLNLIVADPPFITVESEVRADVGSYVSLKCVISSSLPTNMTWFKLSSQSDSILQGYKIREDYTDPVEDYRFELDLSYVNLEDEGMYACVARNNVGEIQGNSYLQLLSEPIWKVVDKEVNFTKSEKLSLSCKLSRPDDSVSVQWLKNGDPISVIHEIFLGTSVNDYLFQLIIMRPQKTDEGVYECRGINSMGSASMQVTANYNAKPQIKAFSEYVFLNVYDVARLKCSVLDGVPDPEVIWIKNDTTLSSVKYLQNGEAVITVDNATESDSGEYHCTAKNSVGSDTAVVHLLVGTPPKLSPMSTNITVDYGNSLDISCIGQGSPSPKITWIKDNEVINSKTKVAPLQINYVHLRNGGYYTCTAESPFGKDEAKIIVKVNSLDASIKKSNETEIVRGLIGEMVELKCISEGIPKPKLLWYKSGVLIDPLLQKSYHISENGSIIIPVLTLRHVGSYECKVNNGLGQDKKYYVLKTYEAPKINMNFGSYLVAKEGTNATLPCNVSGDPEPVVSWFRGSNYQETNRGFRENNSSYLMINNVTEADSGRYICKAENIAGIARRAIVLSVISVPNITNFPKEMSVVSGEVVFLNCLARGNPRPLIKWFKDGKLLEGIHSSYTNYHRFFADPSSTGEYTCVAENKAGEDRRTTTLTVLEPPSISDSTATYVEGLIGHSVELPCVVTGNPTPVVLWYYRGQTVKKIIDSQDSSVPLHLNQLNEDDSGIYFCVASNKAGSTRLAVELAVLKPPKIIEWKNSIKVIPGETVTLSCNALGAPRPDILWSKNNRSLTPEFFSNKGMLRFIVESSHVGNFTCTAINKAGSDSKDITVMVYAVPTFQLSLYEDLEVVKGSTVNVICSATGDPTPEVNWFYNGRLLVENKNKILMNHNKDNLTIIDIGESDEGIYECTATNKAGSNSRSVVISVLVAPTVTKWPKELSVKEGNEVVFKCDAKGKPEPEIKWFKNQTSFTTDLNYRNNKIRFIATSADSANYSCEATNKAGQDSATTFLSVKVHPYIPPPTEEDLKVLVGKSAELECEASGSPQPTITWHFNGTSVSAPSHNFMIKDFKLIIDPVTENHRGKYICTAENPLGSAQKIFRVKVHVPPRIVDDFNELITLKEGDDFSIPCTAYGIPTPDVFWIKDDKMFKKGFQDDHYFVLHDNTLIISNAKMNMHGIYSCLGTNIEGSSMKNYTVDVVAPPKYRKSNADNLTLIEIEESDNGILECPLDTSLVKWLKDDESVDLTQNERADDVHFQLVDGGQTLKITEAFSTDSGLYTCVDNDGKQAMFQVEVLLRPQLLEEFPQIEYELREGEPLTLDCSSAGNPTPKINWRQMEKNLPITKHTVPGVLVKGDNKEYLHFPIVKTFHSGKFMCLVTNKVGRDGRAFTLRVIEPPKLEGPPEERITSTIGDVLSLDCPISGSPTPRFSWKHVAPGKEVALKSNYKKIIINSVSNKDSGFYICNGTNKVGFITKTFILTVLEPPTIIPPRKELVSVSEGEDVIIECKTQGVPLPVINWLKEDYSTDYSATIVTLSEAPLNNTQVHKLIMKSVQKKNEATYTCLASNDVGTVSKEYQLSIIVPPTLTDLSFLYSNKNIEVIEGNTINLKCPVSENRNYQIEWIHYRNGSHSMLDTNNNVLEIHNAAFKDEGIYMCIASNRAGKAEASFIVNVTAPPRFRSNEYVKNQVIMLNDEIILNCSLNMKSLTKILWLKNGFKLSLKDTKNTKLVNHNQTLIIGEAQLNDSGEYICVASNVAGSSERNFYVQIQDAPKIDNEGNSSELSSSTNLTVKLNRRIVLKCPMTGFPSPYIKWYKNDNILNPTEDDFIHILSDGRKLFILQASVKDSGEYKCVAENEAGKNELHFILKVKVDLHWDDWTLWNNCSKECGSGYQSRSRQCGHEFYKLALDNKYIELDNSSCVGSNIETQSCNTQHCQIDGGWGKWTEWSVCSATCGEGIKTSRRECDSPYPAYGGLPCDGPSSQQVSCLLAHCPIDGKWGDWTDWSECAVSCGGGVKFRERRCNAPSPSNGGQPCSGNSRDIVICNPHHCPVNGHWSVWGPWSKCSVSCGAGTKFRFRHCYKPRYGGKPCTGNNKEVQKCGQPCFEQPEAAALLSGSEMSTTSLRSKSFEVLDKPHEPNIQYAIGGKEIVRKMKQHADNKEDLDESKEKNKPEAIIYLKTEIDFNEPESLRNEGTKFTQPVKNYNKNKLKNSEKMHLLKSEVLPFHGVKLNKEYEEMKFTAEINDKSKKCLSGFRFSKSRNICVDINECKYKKWNNCHKIRQKCINIRGSFKCLCAHGFRMDKNKRRCIDINECEEETAECSHFCLNTRGSYRCSCPEGFTLLGDSRNCEPDFDSDDYDESDSMQRDPPFESESYVSSEYDTDFEEEIGIWNNTTLTCPEGFESDITNHLCEDVNECKKSTMNRCSSEQMCINTLGSYRCIDTPCPDDFDLEPMLRSCRLMCNSNKSNCLDGAIKTESISYYSIDTQNKTVEVMQNLMKLRTFGEKNDPLNSTVYEINKNEADLPISVWTEDGLGILYATDTFFIHNMNRFYIKGTTFEDGNILHVTQFIIFIYNSFEII